MIRRTTLTRRRLRGQDEEKEEEPDIPQHRQPQREISSNIWIFPPNIGCGLAWFGEGGITFFSPILEFSVESMLVRGDDRTRGPAGASAS